MYVDTSHRKTYTRYLLRDSFRKDGKVKHRTIASLSSCSQEEIAAIKLALKHKGDLTHLVNLKQIETREGLRVGAAYSLKVIADRIDLTHVPASVREHPPQLFLYDVTSSYLEGAQNILAAFGCNRDGKKGRMQLVIGLLSIQSPQGQCGRRRAVYP